LQVKNILNLKLIKYESVQFENFFVGMVMLINVWKVVYRQQIK